jgi:hypothetical protein
MNKLYLTFILTVLFAPVLFFIYLMNNLVCAPRAIIASAIFGVVPLSFLIIGIRKKILFFFYISLCTLIIEIIITPVIMLKKLGWEKFINERLLAFFTFEGIATVQIIIIILILLDFIKSKENKTPL